MMKRREFLKTTTLTAGAISMGVVPGRAQSSKDSENLEKTMLKQPGKIAMRQYGKSDVKLSVIGFGGIVVMGNDQEHANKLVSEVFERGVNYFDVAPSYGDGEAEIKLGPALEPYRKESFLACKTTERNYESAKKEFERSLERLKTDHFDLYQLHAITDVEKDVDVAFCKGGVMELLLEAKKEGRIRFLGFSAHSHEAALAAMDRYDFDSILFPVNFTTYYNGNFGSEVIKTAREKEVAILALKMFASQHWPKNDPNRETYSKCWYQPITDPKQAKLAMAFTLSQPVAAALPPGNETLFRMAMDLVMEYEPITAAQTEKVKALTMDLNPIFEHKKG
ncbi:MAG: aldo/keto reductase [Planctomycetota bacterium]|jgi:aryl-alcohol dehydrogenase-like predicted oxidoreductase